MRSRPHIVRRAPLRRSIAGSIVLHALLLAAALILTSDYTLPIPGEPAAIALVFQQPAPLAAPVATPPAPLPPAVEPQAPLPTAVPAPPPPATQPSAPEAPLPSPVVEAPSLPLPPPPAPEPPQPARQASPPRAAPRPTPSTVPSHPAAAAPAPAPAAVNTAPPSATASAAQPALSPNWQGALATWLETHKTYPEQARRRGEQGRGSVRFTVDRSGQVLDVAIVSSTGSSLLDSAIERMLRGAHVPPFPANMDEIQVTVTVQIRYALE